MTGSGVCEITARVRELGDPVRAEHAQRFFKTGVGEYAEGDLFLGVSVPEVRKLARQLKGEPRETVFELLKSEFHEVRLLALVLLVDEFDRGSEAAREEIFSGYMEHRRNVNNWDLVDVSAPRIVGGYLLRRDRSKLRELARSASVWDQRIAVLATQHFIRNGDFSSTLELAGHLLRDEHDLIHKAVGWMLREVGTRDPTVLRGYLDEHAVRMPRTMLRYAIEKLDPAERKHYLGSRVGSQG
jgi:3-methyladenine DNA glycosylase AlkD